MTYRHMCLALGLLLLAHPLRAEPLAELALHIVRADYSQEVAYAVVDSVYALDSDAPVKVRALHVVCEGIEDPANWTTTLRVGDTLTFAVAKQNGWRLQAPEKGLVRQCKCSCGKRPRSARLTVQFVTPSGLRTQLKRRGLIVKSWPTAIRIRIGWNDDLAEALAGPARSAVEPARRRS